VPNGNTNDFNANSENKAKDSSTDSAIESNHNLSTKQDSDNIDLSSAENNVGSSTEKNKAEIEPTKQQSVTHRVKKGETMLSIAKHYDVSTKQIMLANNLKRRQVNVGQVLNITSANEADKAAKNKSENKSTKNKATKSSAKTYHVKSKSNAKNKTSQKSSSVKHKKHK
jgi:LysM repeat protein